MTNNANTFDVASIFKIKQDPQKGMIEYDSVNQVGNLTEVSNQDAKYARDNIQRLIETSFDSLHELKDLASQSQQVAAYDVMAKMMKIMLDANKDLMVIHKDSKFLNKPEDSKDIKKTETNQTFFVGSTEELAKIMDSKKKDE